ncbi:hypothetical protein Syun_025174 [Stephania yunnanensis]|uniref:Carboxypeptidase n=1 Tax=Stephania yunnanensis TaxID=152371 RepID=A0AAP0HUN2_9MAGN
MEIRTWVLVFHLLFSLVALMQTNCGVHGSGDVRSGQQERDRVTYLPGLTFNVSFSHYSGYVNVNETTGKWLFYWFIEALEDPSSKPLVIWLEGELKPRNSCCFLDVPTVTRPGCSGIAFGEAAQIGPFRINSDGRTLRFNRDTWHQFANVIYLEFPVGTGFSYSDTPADLLASGDKSTVEENLVFLLKWFERFPQYKGRDFYIAGESYAGHYVPQLARAIIRHQQVPRERSINFKGYLVGNPLTDDYNDHIGFAQFMWSVGLISDQTYEQYNKFCPNMSFALRTGQCLNLVSVVDSEFGRPLTVDRYSIFAPPCDRNYSSFFPPTSGISKMVMLDKKYDPCTENYALTYFNLPEVRKALHVNPNTAPSRWMLCSELNWTESASTVLDIYREVISLGLRVWVYSGNADSIIPITSTRYSINALKLPTASPFRAWYHERRVGGWTQEYVGLNFVSVRGAGHKVILTRPKLSLVLFKSFLEGRSMPDF